MKEHVVEAAAWPSELPLPHPRPHLLAVDVDADALSGTVPHLNNVEVVRLVDRVAEHHLESLGWSRRVMAAEGRMWFVARHEIDYRAESFGGDRLVLATWVRRYGRTTAVRETRIARPRDRVLVAETSTRWVHMDLETRRPTRIPPEAMAACPPESSDRDSPETAR